MSTIASHLPLNISETVSPTSFFRCQNCGYRSNIAKITCIVWPTHSSRIRFLRFFFKI